MRRFVQFGGVALVALAGFAVAGSPPEDGKKKDEDERRPTPRGVPRWTFENVFAAVADARALDEPAAANDIKARFAANADGKNLRSVGEIFEAHPFAIVEKVAKKKLFTDKEAMGLALLRQRMIAEALAKTLEAVDPQKRLTIGLLSSGNKASGIASDVDQTCFVMPKDKAKALGVTEKAVIAEYNRQFKALFGVHPERLGIETHNGADLFPDWRQVHATEKVGTGANALGKEANAFMEEADRVVAENRKNPEAYRSEGQVTNQAMARGYEALQAHSKRVRELEAARDRIDELGNDPGLSDADRKTRIAEVEKALLAKHAEKYPASSLAELEQKLADDSPWTESSWDEEGKVATTQLEDPSGRVLANKPEFHQRFAFDGAWDNWVMFENHPHNARKYLLRSVAEGVSLMRRRSGEPLSTFEYEKVFGKNTAESQAELRAFVDDVYGDLPDEVRQRFKKALDVAAKERLLHKNAKNPSTGKFYTPQEVFSEFWPLLDEKQRALYADVPPASLEKLLLERAQRQWGAVGREVMIENLVRTLDAPAKLLGGTMSDAELSKIKEKFPGATRAKLAKAVQRQIYHGLYDLMTIEHARELAAPPDVKAKLPPRQKDLVDRLIEKIGGPESELGREIQKIARFAAMKRIAVEPGERAFRQQVSSYVRDSLREMLDEKAETWREVTENARSFYEDVKAGKVTREELTRKLVVASAERLGSLKIEALRAIGFDVKNAHILIPESGWPRVEVELGDDTPLGRQKWSGKRLLEHVATAQNVDSALNVVVAYQEGGPRAAAWAAAFEVVMNVPGVAQANAVKDLVVHRRPEGVVILGSAMLIPVAGEVYVAVNIAKNTAIILGHVVLDPLRDDDADKMYQGFLDPSSGYKTIEESRRSSLLHFVPISVIRTEKDGPEGKKIPTVLWQRYSPEEAERIFGIVDPKVYERLAEKGVLGGGPEWDEARAKAEADPRARFEAKRASMVHHFGPAIDALLAPKKIDVDHGEAFPIIVEFFKGYVDQWVNATGAFSGFDENLTIKSRFDAALRERIATRAATDFVASWRLVRGNVAATGTIERNVAAAIEQDRLEEKVHEANGLIVAIDQAWERAEEPELASALDEVLAARKDEARVRAPRFYAWPRLVGEAEGDVEFLVSVTDGPEPGQPEPANKEYRTTVRYELAAATRDSVTVTAYLTCTGVQTGERIPPQAPPESDTFSTTKEGELVVHLGKLARPASLPESADLKVAYRLKDAAAQRDAAAVASANRGKTARGAATTDPTASVLYEDVLAERATARKDSWGGKEVAGFVPQAWVCWEKAPLGKSYWFEVTVQGNRYEQHDEGPIAPRDRFPDQVAGSGRENVFLVPFSWPEGYVGPFTLKGTVVAYAEPVTASSRKTAKPLDRFEFTRTFEIPDARLAASSKLVLRYDKKVTAAEIATLPGLSAAQRESLAKIAGSGVTTVQVREPLDSSQADVWRRKWGTHSPEEGFTFKTEVHVRWKEVPPSADYFYEAFVSGGLPPREEKEEGPITPVDDFPPAPSKTVPGSSAFVIPAPMPMHRGGDFVVRGTIYAVPKGTSSSSWRKATPLATQPFEQRFALRNRCRYVEGMVRANEDASVTVEVVLAYVQHGRRLVKIDASGKTIHAFPNGVYHGAFHREKAPVEKEALSVLMPYGTEPPSEVTVTLRDFGEDVTMTAKLDPAGPGPDLEKLRTQAATVEKAARDRITNLMKNEAANLDPLARAYEDIAGAYRTFDYARWKESAWTAEEYWERLRRKELAAATSDDQKLWARKALVSVSVENLYWGAVQWGRAGEAESEFGALVGKIEGAGLPSNETKTRLSGLYRNHAETVVKLTGDLVRARMLWRQSQDYAKASGSTHLVEATCPYDLDPEFR